MDRGKSVFRGLVLLSLFALVSGCALLDQYGKVRQEIASRGGMDIERLRSNWKDYTIFYSGVAADYPAGILFDPKNDDRALKGHQWIEIKDAETMNKVIGWLDFKTAEFSPRLSRILGPGDHLFGYIYTFHHHVVTKVVNERTLYVMYLDTPMTIRRTFMDK